MNVLAVLRDPCFSPHSVAKDEAILKAVVRQLEERGCQVSVVSEQALTVPFPPDIVLSMGRHDETLRRLKAMGVRCINAPEAVGRCRRSTLQTIMQEAGIPIPPQEGTSGYWLKRGDSAAAMMPGDVVFAAETATLQQLQQGFRQRGITDMVVSAHVEGDELKFYGVRGTGPMKKPVTMFFLSKHCVKRQSGWLLLWAWRFMVATVLSGRTERSASSTSTTGPAFHDAARRRRRPSLSAYCVSKNKNKENKDSKNIGGKEF